MKRILAFVLLMSLVSFAYAGRVDFQGTLTAEQQAELALQATKMAAESKQSSKVTPAAVNEWVEVGNGIGQGLVAAASQLGMEVNKFADTKVGVFAMFMIAYHYVGDDIKGFVIGSLWFIVLVPTWIYMYRRTFIIKSVTYNQKGEGPKKAIEYGPSTNNTDGTVHGMYWVTGMIILVVGAFLIY